MKAGKGKIKLEYVFIVAIALVAVYAVLHQQGLLAGMGMCSTKTELDQYTQLYKEGKLDVSTYMTCIRNCYNAGCDKTNALGVGINIDPWSYDINNDCYINNDETVDSVNDWANGLILIATTIAVHDLEISDTKNPACGSCIGTSMANCASLRTESACNSGYQYFAGQSGSYAIQAGLHQCSWSPAGTCVFKQAVCTPTTQPINCDDKNSSTKDIYDSALGKCVWLPITPTTLPTTNRCSSSTDCGTSTASAVYCKDSTTLVSNVIRFTCNSETVKTCQSGYSCINTDCLVNSYTNCDQIGDSLGKDFYESEPSGYICTSQYFPQISRNCFYSCVFRTTTQPIPPITLSPTTLSTTAPTTQPTSPTTQPISPTTQPITPTTIQTTVTTTAQTTTTTMPTTTNWVDQFTDAINKILKQLEPSICLVLHNCNTP
jgi:hypothetical protein